MAQKTFRAQYAAPAMQVTPRTLKYRPADEHLLRRLGAALVLQWDELSDEMQDLLIDQAVAVDDADPAPHGPGEIETFIRSVKTVSASTKPAK